MKKDACVLGAVILAAGMSKRMGKQKLTLPWVNSTVIGTVVQSVMAAGIETITVVSGKSHEQVSQLLKDLPLTIVFNPYYESGGMISSIKTGLSDMVDKKLDGAMIVLGDQPQITEKVILKLKEMYIRENPGILIPVYQNRRGHPIVLAARFWNEIIKLPPGETLKTWSEMHSREIQTCEVDNPEILQDIDTPEDYELFHGLSAGVI